MFNAFLVTCEHGGNFIPAAWRELFHTRERLLNSHRGHDPGALAMARSLASALDAPLVASTTSRLLVDLNRPARHPQLFSTITRDLSPERRAGIVRRHHRPYQEKVEGLVGSLVKRGRRVVHISSHSFTPELNGEVRRADVGLLYDPGRHGETALCARWQAKLEEDAPQYRVRRNYPYRGKSAGLTAQMRRRFSADSYVGIELEVNQGIFFAAGRRWKELRWLLPRTLLSACVT